MDEFSNGHHIYERTLTLAERERLAYIRGDVEKAALLDGMESAERDAEIEDLKKQLKQADRDAEYLSDECDRWREKCEDAEQKLDDLVERIKDAING